MIVTPKAGLEFTHSRWLDANNQPQRYRVTRVSKGVVYYRPVDGGGAFKCGVEEFSRMVKLDG